MVRLIDLTDFQHDRQKALTSTPWLADWYGGFPGIDREFEGEKDFLELFHMWVDNWSSGRRSFSNVTLPEWSVHESHKQTLKAATCPTGVDRYNAEDFYFTNRGREVNKPHWSSVNVLEIGGGYGRQVNIWSQVADNWRFVNVEAVERQYGSFMTYMDKLDIPWWDFARKGRRSCWLKNYLKDDRAKYNGAYILPTWGMGSLPIGFFDLAIAVQVLQELPLSTLIYILSNTVKSLSSGGTFYIRDHRNEIAFPGAHGLDIDPILQGLGLECVYAPTTKEIGPVHGYPRVWIKR